MYTFSMSATDIVVRNTIFHCCQESIVFPEKNVPSGQEGLLYPVFPLKRKNLINYVESPADQIHNLQVCLRKIQTESRSRQQQGWRERKRVCLPPRAREEPLPHGQAPHPISKESPATLQRKLISAACIRVENHGLGLGGAELHPSRFTVGCEPPQCML
ncbi:hypothetical protein GOODEAATRI_009903 [Goodea atripinnis]|uniref:Uncharacterized protein n=1 Tax=Goodea atripinnis TaxID=208336 RepID=A0ABV0N029_9TELE